MIRIGTSTVQIAGISAGTVAVAGTSTVALSGQVAGPVAAGTAASSSILDGLVYNTAVPVLTNGQQAAKQGDSAANLRVNPFGNVGAFTSATASATFTATIGGSVVLTLCKFQTNGG